MLYRMSQSCYQRYLNDVKLRRSCALMVNFEHMAGFPQVSGTEGIPSTTQKIGLSNHPFPSPPTVLPQKWWFCNFYAVFGQFAQIAPLQIDLIWETLHGVQHSAY